MAPRSLLHLLAAVLAACCAVAVLVPASAAQGVFVSDDIPWSTLTADALANLTTAEVATASASDLEALQPSACSGWSSDQLGVLQDSCSGFAAECVGNMKDEAVSGFSAACANVLTHTTTAGFTASQLANLEAESWASLTADGLSGITGAACTALSSTIVGVLGKNSATFPTSTNACSGLTDACVKYAPDDAFSALQTTCNSFLADGVWAAMRSAQVGNISTEIFKVVTPSQLNQLTDSCAGIQSYQVALLPDDVSLEPAASRMCASLQPTCLSAMPTTSFVDLSRDCVADLNVTAFPLLSASQIAAINTNSSAALTREELAAMVHCDGLRPEQIALLGTWTKPFDACAGFTSACLALIPSESFDAFQSTCFSLLPDDAFTQLTSTQVGGISQDTMQSLTAGQLHSLPSAACSGFTSHQTAVFGVISPYDTCGGFTAECLLALTAEAAGRLTSSCFSSIPSDFISGLSLEQIGDISTEAISGLSAEQILVWTKKFNLDFIGSTWKRPAKTNDLPRATILGFKKAIYKGDIVASYSLPSQAIKQKNKYGVESGSISAISSITSLQLAYCVEACMTVLLASTGAGAKPNLLFLPLHTYRGLRADQLSEVPPPIFAQFGPSVFSQLLGDATSAITPLLISAVDAASFPSLDISALSVTNGCVRALSQAQIQSVAAEQWEERLSCEQFNAFSKQQRTWLGTAITKFNAECIAGAPTPTPCPPEKTTGFSKMVFLASVIGAGAGAFLLSLLAYCCCLRKKGESSTYGDSNSLPKSASRLPITTAARNIRARQSGGKEITMRTPLNPNNFVVPGSSPTILKHAPSYTQSAEVPQADIESEEEDDIGSRF